MLGQHGIKDEINKLIRFYFDSKEHFRLAAKRATGEQQAELTALCEDREAFHIQLQELVTRMNVEMSDNGSVGADLKRDWERLRGAFGGEGLQSALKLAQESETSAIAQADRILQAGVPDQLNRLIQSHVTKMRATQDRLGPMLDAQTQPA
ncbi:MAG TPA: PA2169 family four-helix-bundle protein [Tepidisphaeraceae bacterium]|jgi:uncharacterized protein (TIGR02284 family)